MSLITPKLQQMAQLRKLDKQYNQLIQKGREDSLFLMELKNMKKMTNEANQPIRKYLVEEKILQLMDVKFDELNRTLTSNPVQIEQLHQLWSAEIQTQKLINEHELASLNIDQQIRHLKHCVQSLKNSSEPLTHRIQKLQTSITQENISLNSYRIPDDQSCSNDQINNLIIQLQNLSSFQLSSSFIDRIRKLQFRQIQIQNYDLSKIEEEKLKQLELQLWDLKVQYYNTVQLHHLAQQIQSDLKKNQNFNNKIKQQLAQIKQVNDNFENNKQQVIKQLVIQRQSKLSELHFKHAIKYLDAASYLISIYKSIYQYQPEALSLIEKQQKVWRAEALSLRDKY